MLKGKNRIRETTSGEFWNNLNCVSSFTEPFEA
jgi:hypothetical protein